MTRPGLAGVERSRGLTLIDRYAHAVDPANRAAADILGQLLTEPPAPAGDVVPLT